MVSSDKIENTMRGFVVGFNFKVDSNGVQTGREKLFADSQRLKKNVEHENVRPHAIRRDNFDELCCFVYGQRTPRDVVMIDDGQFLFPFSLFFFGRGFHPDHADGEAHTSTHSARIPDPAARHGRPKSKPVPSSGWKVSQDGMIHGKKRR
jgi:hypothetical protein